MNLLHSLQPAHKALAAAINYWSSFGEHKVDVAFSVLEERADLLGLSSPSNVSANGFARMIECADGWVAVNLPRESDLQLVPALVEATQEDEPWELLRKTAINMSSRQLTERATLLGLAIARIGETPESFKISSSYGNGSAWTRRPRVLDLSSLWAGPLCGAILAAAGCSVIKLESSRRPDTTRQRSPEFDRRLNGGKHLLSFDPYDNESCSQLAERIAQSDIILTNARMRGLASLGIDEALESSTGCWIAITAHSDPDRIGFGDDCAAAGGLVSWLNDGTPQFIGDALADPLTGLAAAATALEALATQRLDNVCMSLSTVARAVNSA